jgi:APA family basic amino acid/polyamine antiporter
MGLRHRINALYDGATAIKSVDHIWADLDSDGASQTVKLKRCLNKFSLVSYGLGGTIGVGVFVLTGHAIEALAGPAAVISYVFAGVACVFSALCYAEFSARIPAAGSAYTFAYAAIGEFVAWIVGWNLTLEYSISGAAIARGWAAYLVQFFSLVGVQVPESIHSWSWGEDISVSPLALLLVIVCSWIVIYGVKESASVNNVITTVNVLTIVFFFALGMVHVDTSRWSNFVPYGFSGVLRASAFLFFALIGFDSVSSMAEECKNPQSDMPFGILMTLFISVTLYSLTALVLSGIGDQQALSSAAPLSAAFENLNISWAGIIVAICAITTTTSTTLCSLLGQPRIFYRMSKDGLMWPLFSKISPRYRTPVFSCILSGVLSGVLAFSLSLVMLSDMISIGTLMSFTIVCLAMIPLRFQATDNEAVRTRGSICSGLLLGLGVVFGICVRFDEWIMAAVCICFVIGLCLYIKRIIPTPSREGEGRVISFLCPGVPFIPACGIVCNCVMLCQLEAMAWLRFGIWSLVGVSIYVFYGYSHSSLRRKNSSSMEEGERLLKGEAKVNKYSEG